MGVFRLTSDAYQWNAFPAPTIWKTHSESENEMIFHMRKIKISFFLFYCCVQKCERRCGSIRNCRSSFPAWCDVIFWSSDSYQFYFFFIYCCLLLWWDDIKRQRGTFQRYYFLGFMPRRWTHKSFSKLFFFTSNSNGNQEYQQATSSSSIWTLNDNMFTQILPFLVFTLWYFSQIFAQQFNIICDEETLSLLAPTPSWRRDARTRIKNIVIRWNLFSQTRWWAQLTFSFISWLIASLHTWYFWCYWLALDILISTQSKKFNGDMEGGRKNNWK